MLAHHTQPGSGSVHPGMAPARPLPGPSQLMGSRILVIYADSQTLHAVAEPLAQAGASIFVHDMAHGQLPQAQSHDAVIVIHDRDNGQTLAWLRGMSQQAHACASVCVIGPRAQLPIDHGIIRECTQILACAELHPQQLEHSLARTVEWTRSWRSAPSTPPEPAQTLLIHDQLSVEPDSHAQHNSLLDLADSWRLTPGERRVFFLIAKGHAYRETGSLLGIAERTVQFHATNIYTKAGVAGRRGFHGFLRSFLGSSGWSDIPHAHHGAEQR